MARRFLMSPPPARWRIRGAANYKSVRRAAVNPRKAFTEWLALADAIERHGGSVGVVPAPEDSAEPLTGLMYTANAGWLRTEDHFRLARLSVAHRQAERSYLRQKLGELFGWQIEDSRSVWEGQADMCRISPAVTLLSYGVRSSPESVGEVAGLLPPGHRWAGVRLREPFFHGDTCMNPLSGRNPTFLVFPGAFATSDEYQVVRDMTKGETDLLEISESDALGYACNSLVLDQAALVPAGLSSELTDRLTDRGYRIEPLDFTELFGKGGGGPRCLVNDVAGETGLQSSYADLRPSLIARLESYPEAEAP
jgi:N-dimethylarginine dimethylaminohydrolase